MSINQEKDCWLSWMSQAKRKPDTSTPQAEFIPEITRRPKISH